jgi:hypothetical protein
MLTIPQCLDDRLTNGGEVVIFTRRPRSSPQKHYFSASRIHFCYRLSESQGLARLEGFGELKKKDYSPMDKTVDFEGNEWSAEHTLRNSALEIIADVLM